MLVDEVLSVGDAEFQQKSLGKMEEVTGEGRTALFVSHNMPSIEALCDRAILLADGHIAFQGDTGDAIDLYLGRQSSDLIPLSDLRSHPKRRSGSVPIFQSIHIRNASTENAKAIYVRDSIIFEMVLKVTESLRSVPRIKLIIDDQFGRAICKFTTEHMVSDPIDATGVSHLRIQCHWDSCPLSPGAYPVTLKAVESDTRADRIEPATILTIYPSDQYETGKLVMRSGMIVPEGRWEFEPLEDAILADSEDVRVAGDSE